MKNTLSDDSLIQAHANVLSYALFVLLTVLLLFFLHLITGILIQFIKVSRILLFNIVTCILLKWIIGEKKT